MTESQSMFSLLKELFPINRSLTGDGVRKTLQILQREIPVLKIHEVPSGTKAFDWTVPDEWNCSEAYIIDPIGKKICDYTRNNLHLVGYSIPVDLSLSLEELQPHLHSLPDQPNAIPYVTSYYERKWGFCISHQERKNLIDGNYHVVINSRLEPGYMTYGEIFIPATEKTEDEIFFSTYICHPSMANNELSGPVVATSLTNWINQLSTRRYNYRFVFLPETIGSIYYVSTHLKELQERVVAGFVLTCLGDDRCYSYVPSRLGKTLADEVALHVLKHQSIEFKRYSFLDRGSDERQYCAPGVDLPIVTICRSKYHCYPEYHTSLDNLQMASEDGLRNSLEIHKKAIFCLENNFTFKSTVLCEPHLGPRGLYPQTGTRNAAKDAELIMNIIAYCDGSTSILKISNMIDQPMDVVVSQAENLHAHKLIEKFQLKI